MHFKTSVVVKHSFRLQAKIFFGYFHILFQANYYFNCDPSSAVAPRLPWQVGVFSWKGQALVARRAKMERKHRQVRQVDHTVDIEIATRLVQLGRIMRREN